MDVPLVNHGQGGQHRIQVNTDTVPPVLLQQVGQQLGRHDSDQPD
jgi:hypothetical protein